MRDAEGTSGRSFVAAWLIAAAPLLGGCTSSGFHPDWGTRATYTPGFRAIKNAAVRAATDPVTWVPLATAGLLHASGVDDDWSEEIADARPLFGDDGEEASDDLRNLSYAAYLATALATPGGRGPGEWIAAKVSGLQVGVATFAVQGVTTSTLKSVTARDRPDRENDRSFPSGHAGQSTAAVTLAVGNLDYVAMPVWVRRTAAVGLYTVAGATGWARIEVEKHYLSDVFAGFAIGHFVARFMEEAFLEAGVHGVSVVSVPVEGGVAFRFDVPLTFRR